MNHTPKTLQQERKEFILKELPKSEFVRVNLEVPKSVRSAWKTAAIERDMTLSELIRESMESYLNK